ncbi:ammonium transporter [Methyloceanibacter sp.]|uniref:ammonium transporter n=1 Tax=Methyloceanibacter sp. TaxID=1965321 RepID=UPI002D2B530B|nr:ammonium transporter [Methyloceanibacter sp.]HZP08140.1 ammonium transporter [Methyloceanibacter sp.]
MIDTGNTAWLITATALVLFMTLPGLALFYGGLVRAENLLSVLMQCFAIACLVSVLWLGFAYSLTFSGGGAYLGDLSRIMLKGVARDAVFPNTSIPETVFFMFQMTFAIITPALIVGAFVERMRFGAVLLFTLLWLSLVYVPVAHWVWGGGWLAQRGVLDFAGGLVVHLTAGVSAVVLAVQLGPRTGFPNDTKPPHAPWMTMAGGCMLWFGWFGFNAGSALKAGGDAGMAMAVTHISAATAALVWIAIEAMKFGKPSMVGAVTGAVAGLASITPASGYVGPVAAVVIGLTGGVICYFMVGLVKRRLLIDDSLDVFAVHGVGGAIGVVLTAIFVDAALGGAGLAEGRSISGQLAIQLTGVAATLLWSALVSFVIAKVLQAVTGLRVNAETEEQGLDLRLHGERGYNM